METELELLLDRLSVCIAKKYAERNKILAFNLAEAWSGKEDELLKRVESLEAELNRTQE